MNLKLSILLMNKIISLRKFTRKHKDPKTEDKEAEMKMTNHIRESSDLLI